jgi:hypothetical protein
MGFKFALSKRQSMQNVQVYEAVEEQTLSIQNNVQEESFGVLQKLNSEEENLIEEKKKLHAQLASLRRKRELKFKIKIRRKKNNIQKLKSEIIDLKFYCENLSKSLRQAHTII